MTGNRFDLKVEGEDYEHPKLELKRLEWDTDAPPDVIIISPETILVKVAKYLSPGNQYCYRLATVARLVEGQLVK